MGNEDTAAEIIRSAMAELAVDLSVGTDVEPILQAVTTYAVELIPEVDFADVLLFADGRHQSIAPTNPLATDLDNMQVGLQQGPCLAAATADATVVCSDLTADERWPDFARAAVAAGVHSMMSFQLYTDSKSARGGVGGRGALNLFSNKHFEYTIEHQAIGAMLATQAATALIAADRQTQFESALASRDLIAQAKGILMERFKVDAVRAFELIKRLSQDTNTPVRVLAGSIVETTVHEGDSGR